MWTGTSMEYNILIRFLTEHYNNHKMELSSLSLL